MYSITRKWLNSLAMTLPFVAFTIESASGLLETRAYPELDPPEVSMASSYIERYFHACMLLVRGIDKGLTYFLQPSYSATICI